MDPIRELVKRARGDDHANLLVERLESSIAALHRTVESHKSSLLEVRTLLEEMRTTIQRLELALGGRPKVDPLTWAAQAQAGELSFHKRPNMRSAESWHEEVAKDWLELGFQPDAWIGKLVVDVGAGSRLRTLYFRGARIAAIEPLGEQFVREVEWQDLDRADELYCVPAEQFVSELQGRADLVVSVNALDHGYDFEASMRNIGTYAKPGSLVFVSFDQHERPDYMHPLVLNEEVARDAFQSAGLAVEKSTRRRRYHGSTGPDALNYWLRSSHPSTAHEDSPIR